MMVNCVHGYFACPIDCQYPLQPNTLRSQSRASMMISTGIGFLSKGKTQKIKSQQASK